VHRAKILLVPVYLMLGKAHLQHALGLIAAPPAQSAQSAQSAQPASDAQPELATQPPSCSVAPQSARSHSAQGLAASDEDEADLSLPDSLGRRASWLAALGLPCSEAPAELVWRDQLAERQRTRLPPSSRPVDACTPPRALTPAETSIVCTAVDMLQQVPGLAGTGMLALHTH
jgi:hypothetical protein